MDPRANNYNLQDLRVRGCTLKDVLDILTAEDDDDGHQPDPEAIFIAPPDPAILTDEDSGDEDGAGTVDNLNARQLCAEAEVRFRGRIEEDRNFDALVGKKKRSWIRGDLEPFLGGFPQAEYNEFKNQSAVDLFELMINDEAVNNFVIQSNMYAMTKNCPNPNISAEEIRCFFAILLLSGYSSVAHKRLYWSHSLDTKNDLVCGAMRRNRFEEIMRFLHCENNENINHNDKMWKLRPFMNKVKENFMKCYIPEQNLSFDESMVKYYGKHSCKQFIRGKPIRFGYKLWSLCTVSGYLISFDIYQGKTQSTNNNYEKHFGKSAAPLLSLIDELEDTKKHLPYHFFFDNLFTSLDILNYFRQVGYGATGTIRENRLYKCSKLTTNKAMKKKPRGTMSQPSAEKMV